VGCLGGREGVRAPAEVRPQGSPGWRGFGSTSLVRSLRPPGWPAVWLSAGLPPGLGWVGVGSAQRDSPPTAACRLRCECALSRGCLGGQDVCTTVARRGACPREGPFSRGTVPVLPARRAAGRRLGGCGGARRLATPPTSRRAPPVPLASPRLARPVRQLHLGHGPWMTWANMISPATQVRYLRR
jgi:hypothetical protein